MKASNDRLVELREKLQGFPYRKADLMRRFNDELVHGEPAKAEGIRTAIQELEKESEEWSNEVNQLEKSHMEVKDDGSGEWKDRQ